MHACKREVGSVILMAKRPFLAFHLHDHHHIKAILYDCVIIVIITITIKEHTFSFLPPLDKVTGEREQHCTNNIVIILLYYKCV